MPKLLDFNSLNQISIELVILHKDLCLLCLLSYNCSYNSQHHYFMNNRLKNFRKYDVGYSFEYYKFFEGTKFYLHSGDIQAHILFSILTMCQEFKPENLDWIFLVQLMICNLNMFQKSIYILKNNPCRWRLLQSMKPTYFIERTYFC